MEHNVSTTAQVKTNNKLLIKKAILKLKTGTKNEVAKETNLSVATCNTLLNELSASNELVEFSLEASKSAGRPAKAYRINGNYRLSCCLSFHCEAGQKEIRYSIINVLGEIVTESIATFSSLPYDSIKELLSSLFTTYPRIEIVSIGFPGIVDRNQKMESPDFSELSGFPLAPSIEKDFCVKCTIENSMNLIAFGLYKEKKVAKDRIMTAISFLDSICTGAGIVINGQIIHGKSNFAGEVSHLPIQYTSGKRGLLSTGKIDPIELIAKTICAFATIINPDFVMLTGNILNVNMMSPILEKCTEIIPSQHVPEITFVQNTDHFYHVGLKIKALDYLESLVD